MKRDNTNVKSVRFINYACLFIIFLSFIQWSCNQPTGISEIAEESISEPDLPVLIDGKKWKANKEMNDVIVKAEQKAKQFNGRELTEYQSLGKKLKSMVKEITNSCTMQGRAHQELHKWLVLHIKYIDRLSESEDMRSASENYKNVLNNFEDYHRYFE